MRLPNPCCVSLPLSFCAGIDKADVAYVVHYDPPASIEGFYQESGR